MISIIMPTYNEKENLPEIVDRIFGAGLFLFP
jgi:glycosyltransferase involved in cell wall biosynthesis